MRITRTYLKRLDSDGEKRQIAANRLFEKAETARGPRMLRLVRASYRALRRAMAVDRTISLGAPYPGWKQLQDYYRMRLVATCAETRQEKAARYALRAAKKALARASANDGDERAALLDATIEYARVTGMTLRFW